MTHLVKVSLKRNTSPQISHLLPRHPTGARGPTIPQHRQVSKQG
jgi:hypothetical protein